MVICNFLTNIDIFAKSNRSRRCFSTLRAVIQLHQHHLKFIYRPSVRQLIYNCQPNSEGQRWLKKASIVKIQNAKSLSKDGTQLLDTVKQRHANCFTVILIGLKQSLLLKLLGICHVFVAHFWKFKSDKIASDWLFG